MKLIVLTCERAGTAARILPRLASSGRHSIVQVVLAGGRSQRTRRAVWRRLQKVRRIGILGAFNGVRLRKWYRQVGNRPLDEICREYGLPFLEVPEINCEETIRIFSAAEADLGLSLGNGYISKAVFGIPRLGMINLHTEVLPRFQGAASVIWPIYELVPETGFTVHQINDRIDQGAILCRHKQPIVFHDTLRQTVEANLEDIRSKTPEAILKVCDEYETLAANAEPQLSGTGYTTPTIWQYWRMVRNHATMRKAVRTSGAPG